MFITVITTEDVSLQLKPIHSTARRIHYRAVIFSFSHARSVTHLDDHTRPLHLQHPAATVALSVVRHLRTFIAVVYVTTTYKSPRRSESFEQTTTLDRRPSRTFWIFSPIIPMISSASTLWKETVHRSKLVHLFN